LRIFLIEQFDFGAENNGVHSLISQPLVEQGQAIWLALNFHLLVYKNFTRDLN